MQLVDLLLLYAMGNHSGHTAMPLLGLELVYVPLLLAGLTLRGRGHARIVRAALIVAVAGISLPVFLSETRILMSYGRWLDEMPQPPAWRNTALAGYGLSVGALVAASVLCRSPSSTESTSEGQPPS